MKVLVTNAIQTETVGDAALLHATIDQVEAAFPGCEIVVSSLDHPDQHPVAAQRPNLGGLRRWSASEDITRSQRALRKLLVSVIGAVWFRGGRAPYRSAARFLPPEVRAELEALEDADLVVGCSGGYLSGTADISGDLAVFCTVAPFALAERLGTPVIVASQSIGPFGHERQRRSAQRVLTGASLVLAREDTSFELARVLGVGPSRLHRSVDSAFGFRPGPADGWREKLGLTDQDTVVGLTAREWLDPTGQARFEHSLARLIDHIQTDLGFRVVLIPQNTSTLVGEDDRVINRRIAAACRGTHSPILVEERCDPTEITGLYASLDLLVGMRFHSVIFALTSSVPSIAIQYHYKAGGIMRDLGLDEWVVDLADSNVATLIERFDRLVEHRQDYLDQLRSVLPAYIARTDEVPGLMRTAVEAGRSSEVPLDTRGAARR